MPVPPRPIFIVLLEIAVTVLMNSVDRKILSKLNKNVLPPKLDTCHQY